MNQFDLKRTNPYYLIKRNIHDAIAENAHELKGVLLDFGCGSKPYVHLFDHTEKYIGLDYENEGHSHKNEDVDVFYNGKEIPFADQYFDSILSSEVFEHVFEFDRTLKELHRVLKPGGKIFITCPFVWNLHEEPHDFARYTPYALRYMFEKNGFDVIKLERRGDFQEVLAQLNIIYKIKWHVLLNITLFKTWIFNNKLFSVREFIQRCIALYYNTGLPARRLKVSAKKRDELYLTNILLARKK